MRPRFLTQFGLKDLRDLPWRANLLVDAALPKPAPEAWPADLQPPPHKGG